MFDEITWILSNHRATPMHPTRLGFAYYLYFFELFIFTSTSFPALTAVCTVEKFKKI